MVTVFGRIERKLDALIAKNEQIQRPNRWVRVSRLELNANWLSSLSPAQTTDGYLYRNNNKTPVLFTEIKLSFQVISVPFSASRPMTPDPDAFIKSRINIKTRHNSILDNVEYCVPVEWFPINETGGIYWGAAVYSKNEDTIKPNLLLDPDDFVWAEIWADEQLDAYHTFPKICAGITATFTHYKEPRR